MTESRVAVKLLTVTLPQEMPPKIAIIEDNPPDAKIVGFALRRADPEIEITVLEDGQRAIDYFFSGKAPACDLVLLDLNLPIVDGFELLERLKRELSSQYIPVVVLSGSSSDEDIQRCKELGANWYLSKPADIGDVFIMAGEIVREWLGPTHPSRAQ